MEIKKDPRVDLKQRRQTYWLTGLTSILAVLFIAFEWTNVTHKYVRNHFGITDIDPEEDMILTLQPSTPPPPPPPMPEVVEILTVVTDDTEVAEIEVQSTESESDMEIQLLSNTTVDEPLVEEDADVNSVFIIVEQNPEFPGGPKALMEYLSKSIRYPSFEAEMGITGKVVLSFVVERDGSITDIQEVRSPSEGLTKEAYRVVQNMPKWKPGKQRGKNVRVKYILPLTFRLA